MVKSTNRGRGSRNADFGVMEMARERPLAAAAAAAGAAAAGLFLWSRRAQISDQLSHLSDQIGEWKEGSRPGEGGEEFSANDDTAGLTTTSQARRTTRRINGSASGRGRARSQPTT